MRPPRRRQTSRRAERRARRRAQLTARPIRPARGLAAWPRAAHLPSPKPKAQSPKPPPPPPSLLPALALALRRFELFLLRFLVRRHLRLELGERVLRAIGRRRQCGKL